MGQREKSKRHWDTIHTEQRQQIEKLEKLGVVFSHELVSDDYPDTSWIGNLQEQEPVAGEYFKVYNAGQYRWHSPEFLYYVPMNSIEANRKDLQKRGYSKHEAHTLAMS